MQTGGPLATTYFIPGGCGVRLYISSFTLSRASRQNIRKRLHTFVVINTLSIRKPDAILSLLSIMAKLLSIVIPVYKVEEYIRKCLDSLIVSSEQLKLLDIVIINDGTPDSSAIIAKEYETKYPGIFRVIDQENRGHGGAWNHGTELAVGKYLFYLDSDDWFETTEFSRLITYLDTCDTDILMLDKQNYRADKSIYEKLTYRNNLIIPGKIYDVNEYDWIGCGVGWKMTYAHDCVYRTSMMQKYLPVFCEHVMYDDVSLQVIPIAIAKDFIYTKIDVYRYFIGRPGQSFDPKVRAVRAADDVTTVLKFILSWITKHRDVPPIEGTRRVWMEENYQAIGTWHYRELALFPYKVAKPRLKEWDSFIRTSYPDIHPNFLVLSYRFFPFAIFFFAFKTNRFFERCRKSFRRRIIELYRYFSNE